MSTDVINEDLYKPPDIPQEPLAEGYGGVDPTEVSKPVESEPVEPVVTEPTEPTEPVEPGEPVSTEEEPESAEESAPQATVSFDLLSRAAAVGMPTDMMSMLGEGLEAAVANAEQRGWTMPVSGQPATAPVEEPVEPAFELPDLTLDLGAEQFDDVTKGVLDKISAHVNSVTKALADKVGGLSADHRKAQRDRAIDDIGMGDQALTQRNKPELYGRGPVYQLQRGSPAHRTRISVLRRAKDLRTDYQADGVELPWDDAIGAAEAMELSLRQRNGVGTSRAGSTNEPVAGQTKAKGTAAAHRPAPRSKNRLVAKTTEQMLKEAREKTVADNQMPAHMVES